MRQLLLLILLALLAFSCARTPSDKDEHKLSEAGESLRLWGMARTYPDGQFHTEKYTAALTQMQLEASLRGADRSGSWDAIGPKNIGGRTLCLAIHPVDTNVMFVGSASGGLWKSTTAGRGVNAWKRVETSFPVLGVSAVAIDPVDPDVLYIGTGEVYNKDNSMPNVAIRVTRGTYGIGILKSTDGGLSWSKSLDWAYGDLRGVQDIKINPLRPATVYAATTEGFLRSYDAGQSWQTIHDRSMAVDIEISPVDTAIVFVTHGSLDDENISGVFRSKDGGATFQLLNNGISSGYSGKAMLSICAGTPNTMYASVGDNFAQEGFYKSTNGGDSWTKTSNKDVSKYQGWYSHDVAVNPTDPSEIIWVGIEVWKSTNSGQQVQRKSYWYNWYFGQVPVGGPEGPSDYVHADIHRAYWLEDDPDKIYCVTDGGIFVSYDGGENWDGRNGGYQTQQVYANLGNSTTNPNYCIGGMQDNSTAIYTGDPAWTRVLGGDGECAGINPLDDQIMYGSSQYLNLYKSVNGGQSFYNITSGEMSGEEASFNGPFEFAPTNPMIMYAGAQSLFRSTDGGESWINTTNGFMANGDVILTMTVNPQNANTLLCSTVPLAAGTARVFKVNAVNGLTTEFSNGLPDRICMDIAYDPLDPNTAYAVFGGFNTGHVWKSSDGGTNWVNIDNSLPDIPTNSVLVDPLHTDHIYIATDLGVWLSRDKGANWELYSADAPNAMLAMHLSISADRQLRVATYGLGVWQTAMAEFVSTTERLNTLALALYPNPVVASATVQFDLVQEAMLRLRVVDLQGSLVEEVSPKRYSTGEHTLRLDCGSWPSGMYGLVLEDSKSGNVLGSRVLVRE